MDYNQYTPAIEAGLSFLKQVGHEEHSYTLTLLIISENPGLAGDAGDGGWWFPLMDHYHKVLVPHKVAVFKRGMEIFDKAYSQIRNGLISHENEKKMWTERMLRHDLSKFSEREEGYSYFKTDKTIFHRAWCAHQGRNSHHPEAYYRVDRAGNIIDVHPMLPLDVAEMVADWQGAADTYGKGGDWIGYIQKNLHQWRWHKDTLGRLSGILRCLDILFRYEWVGKDEIKAIQLDRINAKL